MSFADLLVKENRKWAPLGAHLDQNEGITWIHQSDLHGLITDEDLMDALYWLNAGGHLSIYSGVVTHIGTSKILSLAEGILARRTGVIEFEGELLRVQPHDIVFLIERDGLGD